MEKTPGWPMVAWAVLVLLAGVQEDVNRTARLILSSNVRIIKTL